MNTEIKDIVQIAKAFYQDDDRALEAIYFQGYLAGLSAAKVSRASTVVSPTPPKKKPGRPKKQKVPEPLPDPIEIPDGFTTYTQEQMDEHGLNTQKGWESVGRGLLGNALSVGQATSGDLVYRSNQTFPKTKSKL